MPGSFHMLLEKAVTGTHNYFWLEGGHQGRQTHKTPPSRGILLACHFFFNQPLTLNGPGKPMLCCPGPASSSSVDHEFLTQERFGTGNTGTGPNRGHDPYSMFLFS